MIAGVILRGTPSFDSPARARCQGIPAHHGLETKQAAAAADAFRTAQKATKLEKWVEWLVRWVDWAHARFGNKSAPQRPEEIRI